MTPSEFAAKWKGATLAERAAYQQHFMDLCGMLGVPTPSEADPKGEWYAFERGAEKTGGGDGFADVWKRGHFGWEYKGKRKNLDAAYQQLLQYREALENPPLLVVCDLERFEVHTNFTGTAKKVHRFDLDDLAEDPAGPLAILRAIMGNPEALRPTTTRHEITEEAARQFATLAQALRGRGHVPLRVAHFLNKLLFAMFAEDAGLLPKDIVRRVAEGTAKDPAAFAAALTDLFGKMSKAGGLFGPERIQWFNGGLFDRADVLPMEPDEIEVVRRVSELDWSEVEPSIFGTLFVRGLDPDRRSQLGAQYTDRESILRLVEPVLIDPLRREFEEVKARIVGLLPKWEKTARSARPRVKAENNPEKVLQSFLDRLAGIRVLDPACGSGNFLYVSLQLLKDLEREVIEWGSLTLQTTRTFPRVGPQVVQGIEVNEYAAELARVTIWIGEIQWMLSHGFAYRTNPILQPLDNIACRDAILDLRDPKRPAEPDWPDAEVIVGNPPFLGNKLLRANLGDEYVDALFGAYEGRVSAEADLVIYWHEKARAMVERGRAKRVGLLATQGIRGGANRRVLERVKESGDIFLGWSDRPWILDGASVHISFVGFDDGTEKVRTLDGLPVPEIHANLTTGTDLTKARRLKENLGISFQGPVKVGKFEIAEPLAREMLAKPNPDGRSNSEVIRPWLNGADLTGRSRRMSIIDFGELPQREAALYEAPFEHVRAVVKPARAGAKRLHRAENWWLHGETGAGLRAAVKPLKRYIATPRVSKHRLFAWVPPETLPDAALVAIARDDDFSFGVLHSRPHELWARAKGSQLREAESGFRYTPTSTFETFPFPRSSKKQAAEIAEAAKTLHELREGALNPKKEIPAAELKMRTLTNLYNARPAWLVQAHDRLDRTVLDAYGWPHDIAADDLLSRLLALNLEREPA